MVLKILKYFQHLNDANKYLKHVGLRDLTLIPCSIYILQRVDIGILKRQNFVDLHAEHPVISRFLALARCCRYDANPHFSAFKGFIRKS